MNKTASNIAKKSSRTVYSIVIKEILLNRQEITKKDISQIYKSIEDGFLQGMEDSYKYLSDNKIALKITRVRKKNR